jgi:CcmD family protein
MGRMWRMVRTGVLTCGLAGAGAIASLGAQGETGFEPIGPGDLITEQLPATPLVFGAYAAVWVALLIYILVLWRRLGRVERELADVTARLESR